jgi:hypothetical protein
VAWLVALLLLCLWGMALWWQGRNPNLLAWSLARPIWQPIVLLVLTILIPSLVYHTLRLWLLPVLATHDDLNRAWSRGIENLESRGIAPGDRPLFLMLGSTGSRLEQAILESPPGTFQRLEPLLDQSDSPLEWYLSSDVILLVSRHVGCLSAANAAVAPREDLADEVDSSAADSRSQPAASQNSFIHPGSAQSPPAEVLRRQSDRMAILGELLRTARSPACGLNGVICLVPFPEVCHRSEQAEVQGTAICVDLRILGANLELQFPVICLMTELQREPGFLEVMRRTGVANSTTGRLGRRYELGALAGSRELQNFARLLQHELEVRIYRLFGEQDVLKRPGNRELFELLCRMRSEIARPLAKLITTAFAENAGERPDAIPFHFAGCYIAATGGPTDERAFGPALVQRLIEVQDHVQWTDLAQTRSRWQRTLAVGVWAVVLLLAGLLISHLALRLRLGQSPNSIFGNLTTADQPSPQPAPPDLGSDRLLGELRPR